MSDKDLTQSPEGEFIMFASGDGEVRVECRFEQETLWLPQATIANLYQITPQAVTQHIKAIYEEGELDQNATCKSYLQVQQEGNRQVSRNKLHYSLPVILAVGYRVRSPRGTQFRQWATQTLQEYLIKGFVMDDERLKNPPVGSSVVPDYFDEMLERIRDIRASERRVYLRVREIFALAADYQPSLKETTQFFQTIQNKLHFACTGHTAAELIHLRADASQPHMGLTSYKGEEVRKSDVTVAKIISPRMKSASLIAWLTCGWTLPRIRPVVVNRSFCATGRISWISSCNLMTVRFYTARVKSVRKWPMKKRRRSMFSLPNNNGA